VLASTIVRVAQEAGITTAHVNFSTEDEWRLMGDMGFLQRTGVQFHWENEGYGDFDAFLESLSSRKRKAIRKERREVIESDIQIEILSGGDLTKEVWDSFFAFYRDTGSKKWGTPYLTRRFFDLLGERMGDKVALVMCRRNGRWIAGALNLIGGTTLFGRYWGCIEDHRFLHFEACYYQAIDHAIRLGLDRVEAGAQGSHKIQRGYMPVHTYSAHWIGHEGFRTAVARFLKEEADHVDWEVEAIEREYSPFKRA
jgi:predicted N-acyltransferase